MSPQNKTHCICTFVVGPMARVMFRCRATHTHTQALGLQDGTRYF
jgi:hypothetical protein